MNRDDADLIQVLSPQGRHQPTEGAIPYLPLLEGITPEALLSSYQEMTLTRRLDEVSSALQRQGELALWIPSYGQEAAQIGSAHALGPKDTVFPSYREHGVALARGIDFLDILAVLRGTTYRGWDPETSRFRLYTIVLAAQALHAVGYGMGVAFDQEVGRRPRGEEAVIAYIGDGAMSEGDASEALVFARTYNAPVVFFVQNNQYAISTPASTQTAVPYSERGRGFGIPGYRVDGNDILASYAVTKHVMDRTRAGGGPAIIEAVTYRAGPHTSSDDPTRYRSAEEQERWARRDPIVRLRTYLAGLGVAENAFDQIRQDNDEHAARIRARLLALDPPDPASMFDHVYSDPHPVTEAQKEWLRRYESSVAPPPAPGSPQAALPPETPRRPR